MPGDPTFAEFIRQCAGKRVLFLPHAIRQMSRPERMISSHEVLQVVLARDVIEDYLEDPRGRSALLFGKGTDGRPIHVVCSPKDDYLAIITAYLPDAGEWSPDFRVRRKQ